MVASCPPDETQQALFHRRSVDLRQATGMGSDDTSSLDTSRERARATEPSWYLVVALEATRPLAGALRISLAGITELSIGRGPTRAVIRDGGRLRLELDDRFQSKQHLRLAFVAGAWQLEDDGSKNGTRWRGVR